MEKVRSNGSKKDFRMVFRMVQEYADQMPVVKFCFEQGVKLWNLAGITMQIFDIDQIKIKEFRTTLEQDFSEEIGFQHANIITDILGDGKYLTGSIEGSEKVDIVANG